MRACVFVRACVCVRQVRVHVGKSLHKGPGSVCSPVYQRGDSKEISRQPNIPLVFSQRKQEVEYQPLRPDATGSGLE